MGRLESTDGRTYMQGVLALSGDFSRFSFLCIVKKMTQCLPPDIAEGLKEGF